MIRIIIIALCLAGCATDEPTTSTPSASTPCVLPAATAGSDVDTTSCPTIYPSCAALGCPFAPSSNPIQWAPCTTEICYCGSPALPCDQYM